MRTPSRSICLGLLAACILWWPTVQAANRTAAPLGGTPYLLPGGDFETPALPASPGFQYGPSGSAWTFYSGAGFTRNSTGFTASNPPAPQGAQVLFLQNYGRASQSIDFVAGTYTFELKAAQRGNWQSASQTIELRIDGATVQSITPAGTAYQTFVSGSVNLSSGAHTVELRGMAPFGSDNTIFVDEFRATRVREVLVSGFESPVITAPGGFQYQPTGGPWTFTSGSGLSKNSTGFTAANPPAPQGQQVLFLQGGGTASRSVTIAQTGFYRIRFQAALRGNNLPEVKNIRVTFAGTKVGEFSLPNSNYNEMVALPLYLNPGTYTLTFTGVNPVAGDHTGLVDDVRLEMIHDWQDAQVWGGSVPGPNDDATIPSGSAVGLRGNLNPRNLTVGGELVAAQNQDVDISTKYIMVMGTGSRLDIGQDLAPYEKQADISLTGTPADPQIGMMGSKFIGAMGNALLNLHGAEKISWSRLGANASAGANSITMMEAVDWEVGDEILIVSSRKNWNEAEKRTITAVSAGGTVLTLNLALNYPHMGTVKNYSDGTRNWTADLRAEVGLLSHNIRVEGDNPGAAGYGGHIMIMTGSRAYVGGIELYNMGQKAILGRYPFHWHLLGNVGQGQYFKNSSVHQSYNRAVTIHGTESALVENNFLYDHIGHGVFLEDGSERFNVIRKNVGLLSKRPAPGEELTPSDNQFNQVQNRTPSTYWITNPQNTFEDNVAAGTQGTAYWFAFPTSPMGASASDPRFSGLQPHKLPLISFKGNSAHSCMSGFDIFDQLNPDHSIKTNWGWDEASDHLMENCLWYANDLALYTGIGIGGPVENLKFRNNVFVDNKVGTMFASYSITENSVFVANSGENLFSGTRYAYRVYDGAGQSINNHFVGWDASNASFLLNTGAAIKHPNHYMNGNTFDPAGRPRCVLPDFDVPPGYAGANDPTHPRFWSIVLRDVDGGISGTANSSIVSNQPWLLVGDEEQPANWTRTYRSDHQFALSLLNYNLSPNQNPNIVATRSKPGTATERVYYINGFKEHHQLPVIVNEGFQYSYEYEALPSSRRVNMYMRDALPGDDFVARYVDFGKLGGLSVSSSLGSMTVYSSLAALESGSARGYYRQPNGDLYIKAVANQRDQAFYIQWSSNFSVAAIDSDGDEMPDGDEMLAARNPFEASDLAAEFSTNGDFESWTGISNISGASVSGGSFSGTAINNGDAIVTNSAFNFNSDEVPHLFVRMRASRNTTVEFFFATATQPGYSGSRRVSASYTGGGNWQTLTFNMDAHADWNDTVTDLRLDPVSGLSINFDVDWIRADCQAADADGDGVCDFTDICPALDDHLIGTACNDGNAFTSNDTWRSNCTCMGVMGIAKAAAGVQTDLTEPGIRVYPNPVRDRLFIELPAEGDWELIRLVDLQGRILRTVDLASTVRKVEMDLSAGDIVAGIYFLQIQGGGAMQQVKLVRM